MPTLYKDLSYLTKSNSADFDSIHKPGESSPHSGIYRCEGCGEAIASNLGNPLPPQNHHQHTKEQGDIRWRMIVWAWRAVLGLSPPLRSNRMAELYSYAARGADRAIWSGLILGSLERKSLWGQINAILRNRANKPRFEHFLSTFTIKFKWRAAGQNCVAYLVAHICQTLW